MTNQELANTFNLIADLLEIKGEVVFKTRAYRRAAESLTGLSRDAGDMLADKTLLDVPGIGKAIAEKIQELEETGKLGFLERLTEEVPLSLVEMLQIPDFGPKKATMMWKQMGITSVTDLEAAARAGKLRSLPGMGEKSEAKIISGIEALKRRSGRTPLAVAWPFAQELLKQLRSLPGVSRAEAAGSLRRQRPTVGDLDLMVAAADSAPVMEAITNRSDVIQVSGKGPFKASVEFTNGLRAQVWVHPKERFGTALVYTTGSKEHNVRLRELALTRGLSLSEQAFAKKDGIEILCASEEDVYRVLEMDFVPPEMREDRGEVQAAKAHKLPKVIDGKGWNAELHTHSTWSDGRNSVREMAQAALERGYRLIAITDHSHGLGITQGVRPENLHKVKEEIQAVEKELGSTIRILHGTEVEIKADGTLDYSDEDLATFDLVIASMHVSLRQPRDQVTARMLAAIQNPHVDIIGHPTGRLFPDREGADLNMDVVLEAAQKTGVALEINANPYRLDLEDIYARRAMEMGIPLTINTDAHAPDQMDFLHFGIGMARRGWVTADAVINTWELERLVEWLKNRGAKHG